MVSKDANVNSKIETKELNNTQVIKTKKKMLETETKANLDFLNDISPENIFRGIVYSEILGKPKALRRRR